MNKKVDLTPAYLKAGAAAEYLGISRRHLHTLSKSGVIPYAKLSDKCLIYSRTKLDAVVARLSTK